MDGEEESRPEEAGDSTEKSVSQEENVQNDVESEADVDSSAPQTTKPRGLTFDHYLGGSGIAWGLGTLLMLVVSWSLQYAGVELTVPIILALNILPTMVGGMVATYLFTRISRVNYVVDGAKIGVGGFFLTFLYTSLLGQGVGGAYILTGFLLGGVFGGLITKKIYG
ncbi:MAG: hypothetical protein NWE88_06120 [Candidatus Bathyarchaeota archaeon]|nr:hypothetical protein [Candidatus Bathyarchaeota archaeon]